MTQAGDIVLFRFPQTDLAEGKLRPALLLKKVPGPYDDWLICMVSTQLHQQIEPLEVIIRSVDPEFEETGLKKSSLIRTSRLAVVDASIFEGKLGALRRSRLEEVRERIAAWLRS